MVFGGSKYWYDWRYSEIGIFSRWECKGKLYNNWFTSQAEHDEMAKFWFW